jgi:hypothetical protein
MKQLGNNADLARWRTVVFLSGLQKGIGRNITFQSLKAGETATRLKFESTDSPQVPASFHGYEAMHAIRKGKIRGWRRATR